MSRVAQANSPKSGSLALVTIFVNKSKKARAPYRAVSANLLVPEDTLLGASIDVFSVDETNLDSLISYSLEKVGGETVLKLFYIYYSASLVPVKLLIFRLFRSAG